MIPRCPARLLPVVLLLAAACSSSPKASPPTSVSTSSTTLTTTAPAATTTTTTVGATSTTVSAGGPLPAGFKVADLTWVSDNEGWALGTAPCSHPPCTSVAHTLDGGRTWAGLPAPKAYLLGPGNLGDCVAGAPCVGSIRFADPHVGYAFGKTSLWITANGGHTWTERGTDSTDALEISHGTVIRVTSGTCSPPGCPYQVQTTAVGSTTWHPLAAPTMMGTGGGLAVDGTNLYVAVYQHTAGGAQDAHTLFARSIDNGAHWSTFPDPCTVTASGAEADATAIAAAPSGFLAVGCTGRNPNEAAFVVVSADNGATFSPHRGNLLPTVPANGEYLDHIAAATGQRLAVSVGTFDTTSTDNVAISNDAGADWTVTLTGSAGGAELLGFEDAQTGRAVIDPRTVFTTTDGGGHWSGFTFP